MEEHFFKEIQDFLDNGGEPSTATSVSLDESLRIINQQIVAAFEEIVRAMRAMGEKLMEIWNHYSSLIQARIELNDSFLRSLSTMLRRDKMYRLLCRCPFFPFFLASILATHWPERWLPQLSKPPPFSCFLPLYFFFFSTL